MATSYMKLPYVDRVLRPDAMKPIVVGRTTVGYSLDVRLNYYRGLPLSTIEDLALSIDGEAVPEHLMLIELREKLFPPSQLKLAFSEHWPIKGLITIDVFDAGIEPGAHQVDLTLHLRNPYMQFAPGVWGMIDGSASRELELQESA